MNEQDKKMIAYNSMPAVAALNKVQGFDPRKFIRIDKRLGPVLDLKYKKLWFKLACPQGFVKTNVLNINAQVAIIEAKVFLNREDAEPASSYISTKYAHGTVNKMYIDHARYEAEDQALNDAGFGIQFSDIVQGPAIDRMVVSGAIPVGNAAQQATAKPAEPAQSKNSSQDLPVEKSLPADTEIQDSEPATEPPKAEAVIPIPPTPQNAQPASTSVEPIAQPVQIEPVATEPFEPQAEQSPHDVVHVSEEPAAAQLAEVPIAEPSTCDSDMANSDSMPIIDDTAVPAPEMAQATPKAAPIEYLEQQNPPAGSVEHLPFPMDMDVDAICAEMTREQALSVVVDTGTCAGWTLAEVVEKRPASLKWYLNGYTGESNLMRAGAKILLETNSVSQAG